LIRHWGAERQFPTEVIDEWFRLFPNLKILSSPWFSHDRFRPSTLFQFGGEKWTALELDVRCSGEEFENLSGGCTLKKLSCRDFDALRAGDKLIFPSSISTLDVKPDVWSVLSNQSSQCGALHPPPNSQLRNLRIGLSPTKIAHLADFSRLEYLSIRNIHAHNHDLAWLAGLVHLRRLRLDFSASHDVETSLQVLLFNLPRSLYRIDFPSAVPFGVLASLLQPGTNVSISQLGLPQSVAIYSRRGELDHLRDLCAGRGIELIYFAQKDPIFGTSSSRSMISLAFSTANSVSLLADF
jgi:hypothetical protein